MNGVKMKIVNELHKPLRKNFPKTHVVIKGIFNDLWQADLIDMRNYSDKGYNYILTIIDTGSKLAMAAPLKKKTGVAVSTALESVFKNSKFIPQKFQTDKGTDFFNVHVKKILNKWNVQHYSTYSPLKASIVERFNRTLKNKMWKNFSMKGSYTWVSDLPRLINEYNNTMHRSIGMKPINVTKKDEFHILQMLNKPKYEKKTTKFTDGDMVRLSKTKHAFAKGYLPNYTTEIFKINKVHKTYDVPMFTLEDLQGNLIKGKFYEQEILKTHVPDVYLVEKIIKKVKNKALVKWLGFSDKHNSWINLDQTNL